MNKINIYNRNWVYRHVSFYYHHTLLWQIADKILIFLFLPLLAGQHYLDSLNPLVLFCAFIVYFVFLMFLRNFILATLVPAVYCKRIQRFNNKTIDTNTSEIFQQLSKRNQLIKEIVAQQPALMILTNREAKRLLDDIYRHLDEHYRLHFSKLKTGKCSYIHEHSEVYLRDLLLDGKIYLRHGQIYALATLLTLTSSVLITYLFHHATFHLDRYQAVVTSLGAIATCYFLFTSLYGAVNGPRLEMLLDVAIASKPCNQILAKAINNHRGILTYRVAYHLIHGLNQALHSTD